MNKTSTLLCTRMSYRGKNYLKRCVFILSLQIRFFLFTCFQLFLHQCLSSTTWWARGCAVWSKEPTPWCGWPYPEPLPELAAGSSSKVSRIESDRFSHCTYRAALFHFPAILSGEFRHHHHQLASLVLTDCLCCRSQACCGPPASGLDPQLCRGGPEFHESAGDSGVQCRSAAAWWRAQRTVQTSVCLNCDVNDTQHVIHPLKQQLHEWKFLLFVMFNLFWYTVSFCSLIFKYFPQWLNVILLRFCTQVQFWGTCTLPESFHVLLPYTITGLYFRGKYNTLKFKCIHQQWKMLNIRPVSYLTHRKQYIVTCKYTCDLLLMFVHLITDVFNFYYY